jgi:hypothetical protein
MNFTEYLYRKYNSSIPFIQKNIPVNIENNQTDNKLKEDLDNVDQLLLFIKSNYHTNNVVFVLHPEVGDEYLDLLKKHELKYFRIEKNIQNWAIKNDIHWTCDAHEEIAKQVTSYLENINNF